MLITSLLDNERCLCQTDEVWIVMYKKEVNSIIKIILIWLLGIYCRTSFLFWFYVQGSFVVVCAEGKYGLNCNTRCPEHCKNGHCNNVDGKCTDGCNDGYHGNQCNNRN